MTDIVNESDLKTESPEKASEDKDCTGSVNSAVSDNSDRKKSKDHKKKSKYSDRKHRSSSKSSTSHKSKQKSKENHYRKKRRERCSTENQSGSSHGHMKEEVLSDDQNSSVSDHRPVLLTRSRIRKIERRKAYSSNSSALESDHRKTKSEPIIITIDSESDDDNVSLVSNRPNRSARIKGEIIRKLSRTTTKLSTYKMYDSSSSSESENVKRKKKSKSKSTKTSSSSQTAKRKNFLVNRLACHTRLKLRKHKKPRIPVVYAPSKKKRDLKSIRKRFESHKKKSQESKSSPVPPKTQPHSSPNIDKRTLRSTSTDTTTDTALKRGENLTDCIKKEKNESETENSAGGIGKKNKKEIEGSEDKDKKNKKEIEASEDRDKMNKKEIEGLEDKEARETVQNLEAEFEASEEPMNHPTQAKMTDEAEMEVQSDVNLGPASNTSREEGEDASMELKPDVNSAQELITNQEPKRDAAAKPILSEGRAEARDRDKNVSERKKIKKKIKLCDKVVVRKRGRPRLSDAKPVKNIPSLNDAMQIPFLQSSFCFDVAPKLSKCRECRIAVNRQNRSMHHAYCRFMEYRKLCYNKNGIIFNAGFSEPSEATSEHLSQWLPQLNDPPKDLNSSTSKSLIEHIGDQFCDLIEQEKEALSLHIGKDKIVTWKRIVQGVREMCDVCYTTLFNIHWVCPVCGLAVCIDCYKGRKQGITVEYEDGQPKNRDQYNWLLCTLRQPHDPEKLIMAQIIPGNALWNMRDLLHKARKQWDIPSYCKCNPHSVSSSDKYVSNGVCKQLMCSVTKSFSTERSNFFYNNGSNMQNGESNYDDLDFEVSGSALKWLEGDLDSFRSSDECFSYEDFSSLRGNLLNGMNAEDNSLETEREMTSFSIDEIVACITKSQNSENKENSGKSAIKYFSSRYPQAHSGRDPLPIRIYTKHESDMAFSVVPHSWFCNGRLLFLQQSDHPDNLALFQEQWKRGQPILVKGVDNRLSKELWHPEAFCRDFGEVRNDLVDCRTGAIIKNLPMRRFWEGFESFGKRLKDDDGEYMLLKLKDWPPGEDFSEMLPKRFHDLMSGLPLPEYTHRDGILNLAGRLPPWFVRPDLGPKMYNAYGSALYPTKGTTNLHLDISDAVNVMVYVGIPQDGNAQLHIEEALKAIDEGGCDSLMRARVRNRGAKPGALWHIYNARDADKIRELLTKVAIERGEKLEAHHDPIHDQSWYLDAELRKRLYRDYGVEGYAIAQCLGDAVFIPAGAPHQVRNLHSCVKVAEDFVSPENIAHCFKLTQEFRHLSDTHTNHEDKLQIKNIIYHVVRDALAHLLADPEPADS